MFIINHYSKNSVLTLDGIKIGHYRVKAPNYPLHSKIEFDDVLHLGNMLCNDGILDFNITDTSLHWNITNLLFEDAVKEFKKLHNMEPNIYSNYIEVLLAKQEFKFVKYVFVASGYKRS